jgi:hypothetical protein
MEQKIQSVPRPGEGLLAGIHTDTSTALSTTEFLHPIPTSIKGIQVVVVWASVR